MSVEQTQSKGQIPSVGSGSLVRLGRDFTQIDIPPEKRSAAISAAYWVTCSPCEWTWTSEQQADMARYVLWASQRIEAMQHIASGKPLLHEPNAAGLPRAGDAPAPIPSTQSNP